MTPSIEPGQEYQACNPLDHIRIRVLSAPFPGVTGRPGVTIATLTATGREIRKRTINAGALHETATTRTGQPRISGYRLVQHADGTNAEGSSER